MAVSKVIMLTHICAGLFLGMLIPLVVEEGKPAFTSAMAASLTKIRQMFPQPQSGKSHSPIHEGALVNKDGSGSGEWCTSSPEAQENFKCPVVRIDLKRSKLDALNGHYIKDQSKILQGRAIYMHETGKFFVYWCERFGEWRITIVEYVEIMQTGQCRGWAAGTVGVTLPKVTKWFTTGDRDWEHNPQVSLDCLSASEWSAFKAANASNATSQNSTESAEGLAQQTSFFR